MCALALLAALGAVWPGAASAVVPAGFSDDLVASVPAPTALAFTPDGRMLVSSQGGTLWVVQGGPPASAGTLAPICTNSERGLLGVAVDPDFSSNRFVYLYWTVNKSGTCVNRVARYVLTDANIIDLSSQTLLLDNIPSPAGNHNGGDLFVGKDGYLYVAIGDGGTGGAPARVLNTVSGKILRIMRTGGIPADNPFAGGSCAMTGGVASGVCAEIFALGLRNPYRIAADPNVFGTRFFINDVGQSTWEEIDLGQAGADYGWNVREGFCATGSSTNCGAPPAGMTNPIHAYGRSEGCGAITGGAFVPHGVWPAQYEGSYLFADLNCGRIFELENRGGTFASVPFAPSLPVFSPVALAFGPWGGKQALYYTAYGGGGQVRRIAYTASDHRYRTMGVVTCSAGSLSVAAPRVFASEAPYEWIVWRAHFFRVAGSDWVHGGTGRYLVSPASSVNPATDWYDLATGQFVGTTASVAQSHSTVPPGGMWVALNEIHWLGPGSDHRASDLFLSTSSAGVRATHGLCYWP